MALGVVNHDNCVLHVAEITLLPGFNEVDEAYADRLLNDVHFKMWIEQDRLEVMRTRGNLHVPNPTEVGDKRNFAMEQFGDEARKQRRKALYDQPDQLKVSYSLLQGRGMSPSQARQYLADTYGVDIEEINARLANG